MIKYASRRENLKICQSLCGFIDETLSMKMCLIYDKQIYISLNGAFFPCKIATPYILHHRSCSREHAHAHGKAKGNSLLVEASLPGSSSYTQTEAFSKAHSHLSLCPLSFSRGKSYSEASRKEAFSPITESIGLPVVGSQSKRTCSVVDSSEHSQREGNGRALQKLQSALITLTYQ